MFLLHGDNVFVLRNGAVEFQSVDLPSPAFGLARSRQGEVIWWDQIGQPKSLDGVGVDEETVTFSSVTAANGLEARLVEATLEQEESPHHRCYS